MTRRWHGDDAALPRQVRRGRQLAESSFRTDRGSPGDVLSFFPFGGAVSLGGDIPVTHGAFDDSPSCRPWGVWLWSIAHRGMKARAVVLTESGTTGEVRLALDVDGELYHTSTVAIPADTFQTIEFAWQHGVSPWTGDTVWVYLEARRTGGAGSVRVAYPPAGLAQTPPSGCTATGLP